MTNGIDVSYAQGAINWSQVVTDFVYIKLNTGVDDEDSWVKPNSYQSRAKNIPLGYYHFATLNSSDVVTDAKNEAEDTLTDLFNLPKYDQRLPPVLDIEQQNTLAIPPADIELWISTYVAAMAAEGHKTVLYSYPYWLNSNLLPTHKLGTLPLWVAQYGVSSPTIPVGWANYWMWQYGQGRVAGINTQVDLNKINS
jgi:GH25 family lysozyme M1 (1,4-beta-N-acetylmuramidase)